MLDQTNTNFNSVMTGLADKGGASQDVFLYFNKLFDGIDNW